MTIGTETEDKLKELFELSRLYDVYGSLLSGHAREVFEDYILNNYSLGEIADEVALSRQGVRDLVVRSSKKLREYEECLGFLKKIDETDSGLAKVAKLLSSDQPDVAGAGMLIEELRSKLEV